MKSVLVITANIWNDAEQKKLNDEGYQITVMESISGATVIGSGLTRTKAQQMDALSYNAVFKVQQWLLEHPEWFPGAPGATAASSPVAAGTTASAAPLAPPETDAQPVAETRPSVSLPKSAFVP